MILALAAARAAAAAGEVPVGAVIVRAGEVIATAHNLTETQHDPTAHAEVLAIRAAAAKLGDAPRVGARGRLLVDCDLYVTLEPCAMCAAAISHARLRRVVFGAYDVKGGAVEHGPKWFQQATCLHRPEVLGGLSEVECGELLRNFFEARR
jgi:tRNA(Arg) A34 adenosine deaminase TadA